MARRVVVDRDFGFDKTIKQLVDIKKKEVVIGFQESALTTSQTKGDRTQKAGVSVAEYAAYNEFGTEKIPQRSFMRTAYDENIRSIETLINIQYGRVVDGSTTIDKALSLVGQAMQAYIQKKIRSITYPPNSPATIKIKGSSKPLIDFGQMVNSVTYAIRTMK